MRYNRIGRAGIQVSAVGLGNWNTFGVKVDDADALQILFAARDAGVNFFDTADTYAQGAGETILGRFLRQIARDEVVLGTKLFFPVSADPNDRGLSRKHIVCSVNRSLERLGTDYIDLLQCHRFDEHTPLDETVRAMDDMVRQGKILYWGVSRFGESQLLRCRDLAMAANAAAPISNQFVYNLLERGIEASILPACAALGVGVIGYSPLAQGVLSGKYLGGQCPPESRAAHAQARKDMWQHQPVNEPVIGQLVAVAERHGMNLASMAIAWCLRLSGIASVLTGASCPQQIRSNARASDVMLIPEVLSEIETVLRGAADYDGMEVRRPLLTRKLKLRDGVPCN